MMAMKRVISITRRWPDRSGAMYRKNNASMRCQKMFIDSETCLQRKVRKDRLLTGLIIGSFLVSGMAFAGSEQRHEVQDAEARHEVQDAEARHEVQDVEGRHEVQDVEGRHEVQDAGSRHEVQDAEQRREVQ
jgi:hypothetical protein